MHSPPGPISTNRMSAAVEEQLRQAGTYLVANAPVIAESLVRYPLEKSNTVEALQDYMQERDISHLVFLDSKVEGIERNSLSEKRSYGFEVSLKDGRQLTVIDHHVLDPDLGEGISTGNLVLRYLKENGSLSSDTAVAITHKDCDSLLSALLIAGHLPALECFGAAVLSADHTFEANPIADVAQALEGENTIGQPVALADLAFSIRNFGRFLCRQTLEPEARALVDARLQQREGWIGRLGEFTALENGTYFISLGATKTDPCPEFVPALIPDAKIVLVFHKWGVEDRVVVRALRGLAAGTSIALDDPSLKMQEIIPGFGGRSAAGSSRRSNTPLPAPPADIARRIDANLGIILAAQSTDPLHSLTMPAQNQHNE